MESWWFDAVELTFAIARSPERRRQYTYARSRISGLSLSAVDAWRTFWTRPWLLSGFFKNSLTTAVNICSCVYHRQFAALGLPGLQSYLCIFIHETFYETSKDFVCIINLFCILSNNPDQCSSSIWLIKFIYVLA